MGLPGDGTHRSRSASHGRLLIAPVLSCFLLPGGPFHAFPSHGRCISGSQDSNLTALPQQKADAAARLRFMASAGLKSTGERIARLDKCLDRHDGVVMVDCRGAKPVFRRLAGGGWDDLVAALLSFLLGGAADALPADPAPFALGLPGPEALQTRNTILR